MSADLRERKILWLNSLDGMTISRFFKVIDHYGDIENVWDNFDEKDPFLSFLGEDALKQAKTTRDLEYLDFIIKSRKGIKFISYESPNYPRLLKEIAKPPVILYYAGDMSIFDKSITVVGSRECSSYGKEVAEDLAYNLAQNGVTVVTGGARGIDTSANIGALKAKGKTAVIFGCGLDICYPSENKEMFRDIISSGGCVLTEFKPKTKPNSFNFPERNRILSGVSSGVVVVEAGKKSGTKITVNYALDEGRDVFCVPGSIFSKYSEGPNELIKQGAKLLTGYEDILDEYNWNKESNIIEEKNQYNFGPLDENEQIIVEIINKYNNITVDHLSNMCNIDIVKLNSLLTMMEIKGIVKRQPGNIFSL